MTKGQFGIRLSTSALLAGLVVGGAIVAGCGDESSSTEASTETGQTNGEAAEARSEDSEPAQNTAIPRRVEIPRASPDDLPDLLDRGEVEPAGANDRWTPFATGIHPPDEVSLAWMLDLAGTVVVGEVTAVDSFYAPPGNPVQEGAPTATSGTVRLKVKVDALVAGQLPVVNDDGSIFVDVVLLSSTDPTEFEAPRGPAVFVVTWSDLLPQSWRLLEQQSSKEAVDSYRKTYAEGYTPVTRTGIFQTWGDGLRAPLLEADLMSQIPDVFAANHDRGFEAQDTVHSHDGAEHTHPPEEDASLVPSVVAELEATSASELGAELRRIPLRSTEELRAHLDRIYGERLDYSTDASNPDTAGS
ncbi:MAG: hypothetical protein AAGA65_26205 [Actinomycetota bacterium]